MADRITFYMLSPNGAPPRCVALSRSLIAGFALLFLLVLAALSALLYDYGRLRTASLETRHLRSRLALKTDQLAFQQKQIDTFAREINHLKSRLMALGEFERRIRVVAGLQTDDGTAGFLGIGGSLPEELATGTGQARKRTALMREMHHQMGGLEMATKDRTMGFDRLMEELKSQKNLLACKPSIRPAEGIFSSGFGSRECPFTGLPEFHSGLDIANHQGTPILATADGTITFVGEKGPMGRIVVINHGHGLVTRYAHIDEALKKQGDRVKRGDVVARMGNTGRSTGPHVHYEVRINGVPVDPTDHILN